MLSSCLACTWLKEENLDNYPNPGCPPYEVSYSLDVAPIMEQYCNDPVCHGNVFSQGRIWLNSHAGLTKSIREGRLLGAIRHEPGFNPMPLYEAKLEECLLLTIEWWIDQGMPDN
jgi:hypothetical protein